MLVEDDNNLREIYEARLLAEGYEVLSAKDGEEALALATKERPDLIISDVMMPKISGFDMLDILRTTPGVENTKVVMMTALSQAEDKARADKLGADKYLVKSQVTLEDVARVADELLNGTSPEEAPINQTENTSVPETTEPATVDPTTTPQPQSEPTATPAPPVPATPPIEPAAQAAPPEPTAQPVQTTPEPTTPQVAVPAVQQPTEPESTQPAAQTAPTNSTTSDNNAANGSDDTTTQAQQQPDATGTSTPQDNAQQDQVQDPTASTVSTSSQQAPADTTTAQATPTATDNQATPEPQPENNPEPQTPQQATAAPATPLETVDTQTTAEEEAIIDAQIDDFVQHQLHSNEPAQPESQSEPTAAIAQPESPESALEGTDVTQATTSLPTQAPTETIAVKSAPGQDNNAAPTQPPVPQPQTEAAPTQQPQATPEQAAPQKKNNSSQRVIQPMNDLSQKPDLNQLAEDEEQQDQGPLPASSVIAPNGETLTPPTPQATPNDHDPGNVIQPSSQQTHDPNDPANIAL